MTGETAHCTSIKPGSVKISTANGIIQSSGIGSLKLGNLELTNLLLCQSSIPNLLSVSTLANRGYVTIFDDKGSITIPRSEVLLKLLEQLKSTSIINTRLKGGLYGLNFSHQPRTISLISKTWTEAHEMLGHRFFDDLPRLSKLFNFKLTG